MSLIYVTDTSNSIDRLLQPVPINWDRTLVRFVLYSPLFLAGICASVLVALKINLNPLKYLYSKKSVLDDRTSTKSFMEPVRGKH